MLYARMANVRKQLKDIASNEVKRKDNLGNIM